MKVSKTDENEYTFAMTGEEADRLMYALTKCSEPSAHDAVVAMAKFFGYVPALVEGPEPNIGLKKPQTYTKTVVLNFAKAHMNWTAGPDNIKHWQEMADKAAQCTQMMQSIVDEKVIYAIKALRQCGEPFYSLKDSKDMVDLIRQAFYAGEFTGDEFFAGDVGFKVVFEKKTPPLHYSGNYSTADFFTTISNTKYMTAY